MVYLLDLDEIKTDESKTGEILECLNILIENINEEVEFLQGEEEYLNRYRLETDSEDEIRNDSISIDEVESYGYEFLNKIDTSIFDDEDFFEDNFDSDFEDQIDEDEVLSFLNEYYMINPKNIPPTELF